MSGTLRALVRFVNVPRVAAGLDCGAGRADGRVRCGVDGDVRISDLAVGRAPGDPVAEVAIVAVQFFGIGRPVVRYLERLASHDTALRVLGRLRARFFERIEPLAPGGARGLSQGGSALADGRGRGRAPEPLPAGVSSLRW